MYSGNVNGIDSFESFWLGMSLDSGNWKKMSTHDVIWSYINWFPGGGNEACATIQIQWHFQWLTTGCSKERRFICEYNWDPVTIPDTNTNMEY